MDTAEQNIQVQKKRTFRKFYYRGVELEQLVQLPIAEFGKLLSARGRRRLSRGFSREEVQFLKDCANSKIEAEKKKERPEYVNTMCRQMIIFPQLVGCNIGIHDGRAYIPMEIKPEMIGFKLGEFAPSRKLVSHGKAGIGATSSSKFVPLK